MSTDNSMDMVGQSPHERLRLAVKEYQDAMWAAGTPGTGINYVLRELMDVSNVHGLVHGSGLKCAGPRQEHMAIDSPPPCELATLEQGAKDRMLMCVEELLKEGWAITATLERNMP